MSSRYSVSSKSEARQPSSDPPKSQLEGRMQNFKPRNRDKKKKTRRESRTKKHVCPCSGFESQVQGQHGNVVATRSGVERASALFSLFSFHALIITLM